MAADPFNALAALAAGFIAFFSPCVLPIVPGFLAFVAGGRDRGRLDQFLLTLAFVLGFTITFAIIGFLIGAVGSTPTFQAVEVWLRRIGGVLIIGFGLVMLDLVRLPAFDRDFRFHGRAPAWLGPVGGAAFLGAAFGVGWSPCVGPVLASIILLAGVEGSAISGAVLLTLFSLGLAIPFLLFGLASDRGASFLRRWGGVTRAVETVGGLFLIALGIMVFTGAANRLLAYLVY